MNFDPLFEFIYKGNLEANKLSYTILTALHTWDDLIDKDPATPEEINQAFLDCLFFIPESQLWDVTLRANLFNVYLRWQDANTIEANPESTDNDLAMAWMLRAGVYDIFVLIAAKLYGTAWAQQIGPDVRKFYGETLEQFIQEVRNA